jgi:hypothetical protein
MRLGGIPGENPANISEGNRTAPRKVSARPGEQEPVGAEAVLEGILFILEVRAGPQVPRIAGEGVITRPPDQG